jgi:uncharacterized BrkB/YihY/UPF0761 family membrane protein
LTWINVPSAVSRLDFTMKAVIRATLGVIGAAMIAVGIIPMTPLIWLLVLVHAELPEALKGVRLQFWQTQLIGLAIATAGFALLYWSLLRDRRKRRDRPS